MNRDDLKEFMEGLLEALDDSIDLSEGSAAQTEVIDPVLTKFGTDPFDGDINVLLESSVKEQYPELRIGGAASELIMKTVKAVMDPIRAEGKRIRTSSTRTNAADLTDAEYDELAANFFADRVLGGRASATVYIYFASPRNLTVTGGSEFYGKNGLVFVNQVTTTITASTMAGQVDEGQYYVRIPVEAAESGSQYNVEPGDINSTTAVANYTKVTNKTKGIGGITQESNEEFDARLEVSHTTAAFIDRPGIANEVGRAVAGIRRILVTGYGDAEMLRDVHPTDSPARVTGLCVTMGNMALVFGTWNNGTLPTAGDTLEYLYMPPLFATLPSAQQREEIEITGVVVSTAPISMGMGPLVLLTLARPPRFKTNSLKQLNFLISACAVKAASEDLHIGGSVDVWTETAPDIGTSPVYCSAEPYSRGAIVSALNGDVIVPGAVEPEMWDVIKIGTESAIVLYYTYDSTADQTTIRINKPTITAGSGDYLLIREHTISCDNPGLLLSPAGATVQTIIGSGNAMLSFDIAEAGGGIGSTIVYGGDDYEVTGVNGLAITLRPSASSSSTFSCTARLDNLPFSKPLSEVTKVALASSSGSVESKEIAYGLPIDGRTSGMGGARIKASGRFGFVLPDLKDLVLDADLVDHPARPRGWPSNWDWPRQTSWQLPTDYYRDNPPSWCTTGSTPSGVADWAALVSWSAWTSSPGVPDSTYVVGYPDNAKWPPPFEIDGRLIATMGDDTYDATKKSTPFDPRDWGFKEYNPEEFDLDAYGVFWSHDVLKGLQFSHTLSMHGRRTDGIIVTLYMDDGRRIEVPLPESLFDGKNNTFCAMPDINSKEISQWLQADMAGAGGTTLTLADQMSLEGLVMPNVPIPALAHAAPGDLIEVESGPNAGGYTINEVVVWPVEVGTAWTGINRTNWTNAGNTNLEDQAENQTLTLWLAFASTHQEFPAFQWDSVAKWVAEEFVGSSSIMTSTVYRESAEKLWNLMGSTLMLPKPFNIKNYGFISSGFTVAGYHKTGFDYGLTSVIAADWTPAGIITTTNTVYGYDVSEVPADLRAAVGWRFVAAVGRKYGSSTFMEMWGSSDLQHWEFVPLVPSFIWPSSTTTICTQITLGYTDVAMYLAVCSPGGISYTATSTDARAWSPAVTMTDMAILDSVRIGDVGYWVYADTAAAPNYLMLKEIGGTAIKVSDLDVDTYSTSADSLAATIRVTTKVGSAKEYELSVHWVDGGVNNKFVSTPFAQSAALITMGTAVADGAATKYRMFYTNLFSYYDLIRPNLPTARYSLSALMSFWWDLFVPFTTSDLGASGMNVPNVPGDFQNIIERLFFSSYNVGVPARGTVSVALHGKPTVSFSETKLVGHDGTSPVSLVVNPAAKHALFGSGTPSASRLDTVTFDASYAGAVVLGSPDDPHDLGVTTADKVRIYREVKLWGNSPSKKDATSRYCFVISGTSVSIPTGCPDAFDFASVGDYILTDTAAHKITKWVSPKEVYTESAIGSTSDSVLFSGYGTVTLGNQISVISRTGLPVVGATIQIMGAGVDDGVPTDVTGWADPLMDVTYASLRVGAVVSFVGFAAADQVYGTPGNVFSTSYYEYAISSIAYTPGVPAVSTINLSRSFNLIIPAYKPPIHIYRPGTVIAHNAETASLPVVGLSFNANIADNTKVEPISSTYKTLGWYHPSSDPKVAYSASEEPMLRIPPFAFIGDELDLSQIVILNEKKLTVDYLWSPTALGVQELIDQDTYRSVLADGLARTFLPAKFGLSVTAEKTLSVEKLGEYLRPMVEGSLATRSLTTSDIEAMLRRKGVGRVKQPLVMYVLVWDLDRKLILERYDSKIGYPYYRFYGSERIVDLHVVTDTTLPLEVLLWDI